MAFEFRQGDFATGKFLRGRDLSEQPRLFRSVIVERLEEELIYCELPSSRAGCATDFKADTMALCCRSLKKDGTLRSVFGQIADSDLIRYVSELLLFHCTGFSMTNSFELLKQDEAQEPALERMRCQRQGPDVPYAKQHLCNLDDDICGARAADNQNNAYKSRKADVEGHCAHALADGLFRITFIVRVRRRGKMETENMQHLLKWVLKSRGVQSFHGVTITAGRGCAKMSPMKELL